MWQAQVAIELSDTETAETYKNLLNGDCLSSLQGGIVQPCASNAVGHYVVWERLPSFASPNSESGYYETNPTGKQFTQMYTTYPGGYLIGSQGTIPTTSGTTQPQYFLCGS